MVSSTKQITVGNIFNPNLDYGARGVIQFNKGDEDLSIYGSLDDATYILIEAYTASALKEIALPPYIAVVVGSTATYTKGSLPSTSFGTSTFYINETR
tara:strand:+ start:345 stop:638 length:294 start_codon:yes stop_codon:yes gene_type:complete